MKQAHKTFAFWLFIVLLCLLLLAVVKQQGASSVDEVTYDQFTTELTEGTIAKVTLSADGTLTGERNDTDGTRFAGTVIVNDALLAQLAAATQSSGAKVTVQHLKAESKGWGGGFFQWLPLIFIVFFMIFLMRQLQGGSRNYRLNPFDEVLERRVCFAIGAIYVPCMPQAFEGPEP